MTNQATNPPANPSHHMAWLPTRSPATNPPPSPYKPLNISAVQFDIFKRVNAFAFGRKLLGDNHEGLTFQSEYAKFSVRSKYFVHIAITILSDPFSWCNSFCNRRSR